MSPRNIHIKISLVNEHIKQYLYNYCHNGVQISGSVVVKMTQLNQIDLSMSVRPIDSYNTDTVYMVPHIFCWQPSHFRQTPITIRSHFVHPWYIRVSKWCNVYFKKIIYLMTPRAGYLLSYRIFRHISTSTSTNYWRDNFYKQYFSYIVRSVLLVEETEVTGEYHWPVASHWQTLSHNVVSTTPRHEQDSNWQL
jgi:hypothetical protein